MKRGWWITALLCSTTAIVGYSAANRRAVVLEGFLERISLEQDSLRAVMAEQSYMLDRVTDARTSDASVGEVERLRAQLDQTTAFLNEARSAADERSRAYETQRAALQEKESALRDCGDVQGRLEQQLESCIFEKAAYDRRAKPSPKPTTERATSGSSRFSQSVEFPDAPGD